MGGTRRTCSCSLFVERSEIGAWVVVPVRALAALLRLPSSPTAHCRCSVYYFPHARQLITLVPGQHSFTSRQALSSHGLAQTEAAIRPEQLPVHHKSLDPICPHQSRLLWRAGRVCPDPQVGFRLERHVFGSLARLLCVPWRDKLSCAGRPLCHWLWENPNSAVDIRQGMPTDARGRLVHA